jgi:hypothetical protein
MAAPRCIVWRQVRGLDNSTTVRGFADTLSVAPLTYHVHHDDGDLVVFGFATPTPQDADVFCQRFGGERLPETQR